MSSSKEQPQEPTIEDCSDDEDVYYSNNNNNNTCNNNNNNECEDANNNNTTHPFHKLGDRALNIQVTAKQVHPLVPLACLRLLQVVPELPSFILRLEWLSQSILP